ncbi:MAG: NAD(P)H-hydrate dehydratase [Afipia sp.]|nr:NAD(P)H-hydrate dehydratase [Afipia sp.]
MEVLSVSEMARADAEAIARGTSGFTLMQNAGRAVARAALEMCPQGTILVVAGRGNNGGDGFVAATELAASGRDVSLVLLCERASLKGDAALAAAEWKGAVLPFASSSLGRPSLIIDALFGAGLDRPVKGDPRTMIEAMNANGAPILSIDLPSGIHGDSGAVMGVAVNAARTVTFFRRKPAHLLLPGRLHCGEVVVADIGISRDVLDTIKPQTFENVPELWADAFPVPQIDGHKYARGHAVVVSGDMAATGAARLSARGALRAGAGLVTVATPADALAINAAALTAVMVRVTDGVHQFSELLNDKRLNSVVIGPGAGIGERTRNFVGTVLKLQRALVLDADALTSFADDPKALFAAIKKQSATRVVLTPHEGEFKRLFGDLDATASKLQRARDAAAKSGAVVLIKGPDTVVASRDGRAAIAANAPPWLATAGSGDVLAGMIGGVLAQNVPPFEAACIAVWMHGEAGHAFGPGLIAEDLPDVLPEVFRNLYDELGVGY